MRAGQASTTAALVALARAIAHADAELGSICHDPFAAQLLPPALGRVARRAARSPSAARALRHAALGLVDHLSLRTALIDEALGEALAAGASQLVLLGAGLDSRAYRIKALRDAHVFEVDHPDTQQTKRRATHGLAPLARALTYAACDFQRVRLPQALQSAGHDPAQQSVWIWEGVTMYLTGDAIDATIADMSARSPRGCTAIVTFVTPQLTVDARWLGTLGARSLALFSEPLRSPMLTEELTARFAAHGFRLLRDTRPTAAGGRFGIKLDRWAHLLPDERVAVLQRT